MKSFQRTLAIGVFAIGATAFGANEPAYTPATIVDVYGTVAAVHNSPAGSALEGTHLTLRTKTGNVDVYLAPADFLRILKTDFPVGNEVEVIGSKIKFQNSDVILTKEVSVGQATIELLRDAQGAPVWKNWGVEIDPSTLR